MQTLILGKTCLQQLVARIGISNLMDELIERLERGFQAFDSNLTEIPQRAGFHYDTPSTGLIEWMPLYQRGNSVLMKVVGYHPDSPHRHGTPTIVSTMSTYDTSTGHLTSIADGTLLTAIRTGAASAVATKLLARADSKILGIVGCGAQAVTQLHAISRQFALQEVLIYDVDSSVSESFVDRAKFCDLESVSITSATLEDIALRSDILCTATSVEVGGGPVIALDRCKPWLHVNAVGSDLPGKTELPLAFLQESFICPDFLPQARVEGECQQLSAQHIGPTIVEVAKSAERYLPEQEHQSVFDSTGWALEDWLVMELVLEKANEFGLGELVALECLSEEPRNPYEFLTESSLEECCDNSLPATLMQ